MTVKEYVVKHPLALKWQYRQIKEKGFGWVERSKLKNKNFSIISNNCVSGFFYGRLGLPFTTPTAWTFMFADDYLRFLERLEEYLMQPLEFIGESRHACRFNDIRQCEIVRRPGHPIGLLGGDVEVHFLNDASKEEALDKWNRRSKRVNFDNLFILLADSFFADSEFNEEQFKRFDNLPFRHKLFISTKLRVPDCNYAVYLKKDREYQNDVAKWLVGESCFYVHRSLDIVKWLNGEEDFIK